MGCGKSFSLDLPDAPEGFSWVQVKEIRGAFLVPGSWYFGFAGHGTGNTYTISRERSEDADDIETGLVIVIQQKDDQGLNEGVLPSVIAEERFREAQRTRLIEKSYVGTQGSFDTYRYQYIGMREDKVRYRKYRMLVANDATGTLYTVTFVSSLQEWEDNWNKAEVILRNMILDDEV